jgi:hypothetical protein
MVEAMLTFAQPARAGGGTIDDVGFKIADAPQELRAAFQLIYRSYLAAGLTHANPQAMRITPWHLLPTTEIIVAKLRDEVIGTVSLVADGEMGVPMESLFGAHVAERRERGSRLAEVSCLADRRKHFARTIPLVLRLMSLLGQTARVRGIETLLIVVHPRHARFYERFIGFQRMGEEKSYAAVCGKPAVALELHLPSMEQHHPEAHQRFFGSPFSSAELQPRCMSEAIRCLLNEAAKIGAA